MFRTFRIAACGTFALLSALWAGPANAKVVLDTSGKGEMIALIGEIKKEDVGQLTAILQTTKLKIPFLMLEGSNGGDPYAAMDLGRLIRKNNFTVWIYDKCLSACALVYIAGVDRQNFGVIGLHRPYLVGTPMPTAQVAAATQTMLADIKKYVSDMNVVGEFNDIMVNTDPANMRVYLKKEIEPLIPEYDPLYSEVITAYWARVYGVSTEEYRRRKASADANCWTNNTGQSGVNGLSSAQVCAFATFWGLPEPIFEARIVQAMQTCPPSDEKASALNMAASNWDNPIQRQQEDCMRRAMLTIPRPLNFAIKPQFHLALSFHEGLAVVDDGSWHTGFIDKRGQYVISPKFIRAGSFHGGLALAEIGDGKVDKFGSPTGKWGVIDKQGTFVIAPQFDSIDGSFDEGLAAVKVGDKWGFIDRQGKIIIKPQFDWAGPFQNALAPVNIASKWGFIDSHGNLAIKPQFSRAHQFQGGMAAITLPDKAGTERWGFIDTQGKIVVRPQFDEVEEFQEGLAAVGVFNNEWKWGFIDKQGKFAIKPVFDWCDSFQNGFAAAKIDDKWGLINRRGEFTIRPQFEWAESYSEGLARVEVEGKWGFIAQ
ncbi:MAG TPA: WG repeat-containing protein [Rhizomicrobium sp.]|nr:WG repeat-containing protein [Rhizomicrobium sp.]